MTRQDRPPSLSRRGLLLGAGALVAGTAAGCSTPTEGPPVPTAAASTPSPTATPSTAPRTPTPSPERRTLLAYFSRAGENYYYGGRRDLDVGNTGVVARMIADLTECDVYRIEAADPYPGAYEATVQRNGREQRADDRPGIANPLASVEQYDTVLIGSPIWNVRTPMIMTTFAESHDFTGKSVRPFVPYAMSGLGQARQNYTDACPGARIGDGLAVLGEESADARSDVEAWLRAAGR